MIRVPRLAFSLLLLWMFMKVLIIEQEKTLQQSLQLFMERYKNYEVFLASSKREGMSLFQTFRFDMVLCGDRLPDGSGLETVKELMKLNPKLVSIYMTVHDDDRLRNDAMKAGVQGYLVKPFDLKQLEEMMSVGHLS
jgi:DNA-binding response OmpR family regulator